MDKELHLIGGVPDFQPGERFTLKNRQWQGCPAIERTPGGRLWATWFTGGHTEPHMDNHNIIAISDDDGKTWVDPYIVIPQPPHPRVRMLEAQFWVDPSGALWMFWTQTVCGEEVLQPGYIFDQARCLNVPGVNCVAIPYDFWDDRYGVWASVTRNPDDEKPVWSAPRRLCDGFLRNKPIALQDGRWIMCAYDSLYPTYTCYVSEDKGETWTCRHGALKVENRQTDETMMVERKDGVLWMLMRNRGCYDKLGQSFSFDGGNTWMPYGYSTIRNPGSRFYIGRLKSGRLLMVNHYDFEYHTRSRLTALLSEDEGVTWPYHLLLDERDKVSYPDVAQAQDGKIYVIYDRVRQYPGEILLACFREEDILAGKLVSEDGKLKQMISRLDTVTE